MIGHSVVVIKRETQTSSLSTLPGHRHPDPARAERVPGQGRRVRPAGDEPEHRLDLRRRQRRHGAPPLQDLPRAARQVPRGEGLPLDTHAATAEG